MLQNVRMRQVAADGLPALFGLMSSYTQTSHSAVQLIYQAATAHTTPTGLSLTRLIAADRDHCPACALITRSLCSVPVMLLPRYKRSRLLPLS